MKEPHRWYTRDPNSILPTKQVRVVDESDYDAVLAANKDCIAWFDAAKADRDALAARVAELEAAARKYLAVLDVAREVGSRAGSMGLDCHMQDLDESEQRLRAAMNGGAIVHDHCSKCGHGSIIGGVLDCPYGPNYPECEKRAMKGEASPQNQPFRWIEFSCGCSCAGSGELPDVCPTHKQPVG